MRNTVLHAATQWLLLLMVSFFTQCVLASDLVDFTSTVEKVSPAVVSIVTFTESSLDDVREPLIPDDLREELEKTPLMGELKNLWGDKIDEKLSGEEEPGLGSGSIISSDGYVLTNYHVVKDSKLIIVKLKTKKEYKAKVVGVDQGTDLALLKIDAKDLPFIVMSDTPVKVGQWVLAIGSPYGFEDTLTVGVVSAKERSLGQEKYVPFIQTDVAINPGNSGGPLLNISGEMVGMNSQIVSESGSYIGLSFAAPVSVLKSVTDQLKTQGFVERGWLGLAFQDLDRDLAESFGVVNVRGALVSRVIADSPADNAGMEIGDIIVNYHEIEINKAADIPPITGLLKIGTKIKVEFIRDKRKIERIVVLGKSKNDTIKREVVKEEKVTQNATGILVRDAADDEVGVVVVTCYSAPWKRAGIRSGDQILEVNQVPVSSNKDFYQAIEGTRSSKPVAVLILRPGSVERYVSVKFEELKM